MILLVNKCICIAFMVMISSPIDSLLQKLHKLSVEQQDFPEYHPHDYSSEGINTSSVSLDKLSFQSIGDDLGFLQNLGSKFCTLDEIFQQRIKEKDMKL